MSFLMTSQKGGSQMTLRQVLGFVVGKPLPHPYPEHMKFARACAADGMVLLKNERETLPLKTKKIALFGAGAVDTVTCGTGSGYVFAPYTINVLQGLLGVGFEITSKRWLNRFEKASKLANQKDKTLSKIDRTWSGIKILIDELPVADDELLESQEAGTAIYVVRRNAGENNDRKAQKGDYYLSDIERTNLEHIAAAFSHTVVVLNTCVVDGNFINEIPGIDAVLLMGLAGNESGNALADVLTGKAYPGGRLTDTWAKQYSDYPASATFGDNDGNSIQEDYTEDIFVGYRYFDTFGIAPLFPFGYGLGYTTFGITVLNVTANWTQIEILAEVKNTGKTVGNEVVQIYVSAPEGRLTKPYQELKGFAKTKPLQPDESEKINIIFPTDSLSSYDSDTASFVMEAGDYLVRVGRSSRDTFIGAVLRLDSEAVLRKVRNRLVGDHEMDTLTPPLRPTETIESDWVLKLFSKDCVPADSSDINERVTRTYAAKDVKHETAVSGSDFELPFPTRQELIRVRDCPESTLYEVAVGKVSMEEFVASLDSEVLVRLVAGAANEASYIAPNRLKKKTKPIKAPSSSGSTTGMFARSLGIPAMYVTDGPAGLHIPFCAATCYPVGMVMAQTWSLNNCLKMGEGIGKELAFYNYSVILGPGLNIHRDPLCGRSFEYYSEDPLLTGKMASATTLGVQKTPGTGVSLKHFACNNQETNRLTMNCTVTERALREIYLRGFEICVREAAPMTVMTSYNKLNGIHTSSNYELLTEILRGEWGFDGLVMTDWGTKSIKPFDLHAGNDLIMGGYRSQSLMAALTGMPPEFARDGYVKEERVKVYGGFITEDIEYWNAFEPMQNGSDSVSTKVAPGIPVSKKALAMVTQGRADMKELPDGGKEITYTGVNKGAYLSLGDLQKSTVAVLKVILKSMSYDIISKKL
jgi:beta-glucosidase